ncbi:MAG TPA: arsenite methyltransferase [Candidatus Saccharimonadales bacterium]|nr:arsenite methyltransferase [Candidatus Saccharimonadales bacterium]
MKTRPGSTHPRRPARRTKAPCPEDVETARLAWALAHPARVAIVRMLLERGECVCGQIVLGLPLAQATVSQHLKVLKQAGLVRGEVDGPRVCYCIDPAGIARVKALVGGLKPPGGEMSVEQDIRIVVRDKYGAIAEGRRGCAPGCCGENPGVMDLLGYTAEQAAAVPEGADLGLGCGNPLAHAAVRPGETVLDLGSGAGIDCFLAARETGPTGWVIGVDMTPAMLEKARANAAKAGVANVEFRLGEIEHLPVPDGAVDVVISNCVVNLSPDKPQVFREALRALRPGGRMLVSDLVLLRPLDPALQKNVDLYVGCVAGAALREDYLRMIREAGFAGVEVVEERPYTVGESFLAPDSPEAAAFQAVTSVKVRALKPA